MPALVALAACDPQDVSTIARKHDPVVLTGAGLPSLAGASPERIVAYSYNRFVDPPWRQVPVQVDERILQRLDIDTRGLWLATVGGHGLHRPNMSDRMVRRISVTSCTACLIDL